MGNRNSNAAALLVVVPYASPNPKCSVRIAAIGVQEEGRIWLRLVALDLQTDRPMKIAVDRMADEKDGVPARGVTTSGPVGPRQRQVAGVSWPRRAG